MREAMLLRHFGKAYPPSEAEIQRFFKDTPRAELTALYEKTFVEPLRRNGLDPAQFRQGSWFTAEGKQRVNGVGDSYGTARELMRYLLRMEQGRLVDEFSSREIKRLIYVTERRIRYASSPALAEAAVRGLTGLAPSLAAAVAAFGGRRVVHGGIIYAAGETDIDDPQSGLHRRDQIGIVRRDGWVSVDPGKYSLAPWFAERVATEVCGRSAR